MNKHKQNKKQQRRWREFFRRHPFWTAFAIGCLYFGLVISWMFTIKTAEIAQGFAVKMVAFSAGLIMTTSFALGLVVFLWLYRLFKLKLSQDRALILVPAIWLVSEYVRAIIFSISSMGPGGRLGPYWTFGNFGYYLAETPLAFIARFGGLYLLSGVAALLVVAGYQSYKKRSALPILPVVAVLAALSWLGYVSYAQATGPQRVVGAVRYAQKDQPTMYAKESHDLLKGFSDKSLDVLVLPEYSHYFEEDVEADKTVIGRVMKKPEGLIIHSARENNAGLGHNMLTFQASDGTMLNQQQKWFVVPAGEFVPYIYQVILAYAGQERLLLDFNNQKSINRGESIEKPYVFDGVSYGAHACSGVIAPDFYNQLAQADANIFTNSAALDTMGISPLFHIESQNMNKLSSIAHARPFVQGAKGGPTYIIDKDGRVIAKNDAKSGGVVVASVQTNTTKTLYTYLGEWVVYISIVGLAGYFVYMKKKSKKV